MRRLLPIFPLALLLACPGPDPEPPAAEWELVHRDLSGALLSVWGSSSTDVWAVGADALDGTGPTVIHFDGSSWSRIPTGEAQGNLWWVFGFANGAVYMGGEGGVILRHEGGSFTKLTTPGIGTVYGIWGASPDDVWAVGGASGSMGGFAWRLDGDTWVEEPTLPAEVPTSAAIWKVSGTSNDDAWLVGSNGVSLRWDGQLLNPGNTGVGTSLFTVDADAEGRYTAVGGTASGIIVEYDGSSWTNVTPSAEPPPGLSGVALGDDGFGVAVGSFGAVYARSADEGWSPVELGFNLPLTLHGVWVDELGCAWAVGGQVLSPPYVDGLLIHSGPSISSEGL